MKHTSQLRDTSIFQTSECINNKYGTVFSAWSVPTAEHASLEYVMPMLINNWTKRERCSLYVLCLDVTGRTNEKWAGEWVRWLVGHWIRGLLRYSCSELLLWEEVSWGIGAVREPKGRKISVVWSRRQTTGEDTTDWENVCVLEVCKVCELVKLLY
jgi:hypothetical protein